MNQGPIKVAILGINYAPEPTGIAPYTTGLARGLAERGHEVEVLTGFQHYPQWERARGECSVPQRGDRRARARSPSQSPCAAASSRGLGRGFMELTFGLQLLTTRWNRPDVVICVSPPLLASMLSAVRARLAWRRPAVGLVLHDVYSTGVVEVAAMSRGPAHLVQMLESATARLVDSVAVIHDGFTNVLVDQLGVDRGRIRAIRNWNHVGTRIPLRARPSARHMAGAQTRW